MPMSQNRRFLRVKVSLSREAKYRASSALQINPFGSQWVKMRGDNGGFFIGAINLFLFTRCKQAALYQSVRPLHEIIAAIMLTGYRCAAC